MRNKLAVSQTQLDSRNSPIQHAPLLPQLCHAPPPYPLSARARTEVEVGGEDEGAVGGDGVVRAGRRVHARHDPLAPDLGVQRTLGDQPVRLGVPCTCEKGNTTGAQSRTADSQNGTHGLLAI
jgi:hypothetical protein